ncbi:D-aminoacyl-tRNA deacylase [Alicyclobacillus herbarius]|uniref:D-aminoacyl-tRNA deacylase n=1 Tax=Alicyclobacillus herbarius TaxID=122960 RepID=UPI000418F474|nr:D-aminoacyl-tRNA deacylase [Alicyclobacillus herbarius]
MKLKVKAILAATVLAAGTFGTITAFAATNNSPTSGTGSAPKQHAWHRSYGHGREFAFGAATTEIAKILGIDKSTLKADLKSGQTLAQIAQSNGVSEQTLISKLEAGFKQHLDQAVQNGKLTASKEQALIQKFDANVQKLVEHKFTAHPAKKAKALKVIAQVLGVSEQTLLQDLKNGQSIAQVAKSKGISTDSLVSQLVTKAKARLDQAVQNGKLTASKEQQILNNLQKRLTRLVEGQKLLAHPDKAKPGTASVASTSASQS